MAWQHPSHSHEAQVSHHAKPELIEARSTVNINARHRHSFYIWNAADGQKAPLWNKQKKWFRRFTVDGHKGRLQNIVAGASVQLKLVNMGLKDAALHRANDVVAVITKNGGAVEVGAVDGDVLEVACVGSNAERRRIVVSRSDGDPQLVLLQECRADGLDKSEL